MLQQNTMDSEAYAIEFSQSSGGWKSQIQLLVWWGFSSWLAEGNCFTVWSDDRESKLSGLLLKGHWFHPEGPTLLTSSDPNYLSKTLFSNNPHWGLKLQHINFGWGKQFSAKQVLLKQLLCKIPILLQHTHCIPSTETKQAKDTHSFV